MFAYRARPIKLEVSGEREINRYKELLNKCEAFEVRLRDHYGKVYVTDILVRTIDPGRYAFDMNLPPQATVTLQPTGPDIRLTSAKEAAKEGYIKQTMSTIERMLRAGNAHIEMRRDSYPAPRSFNDDSFERYETGRELTVTIKAILPEEPDPAVMNCRCVPLNIPKLWDVPLSLKDLATVGESPVETARKHLDKTLRHAMRYDMGPRFMGAALEQARDRLSRSVREKIDAMMTGTLETKHKEKKAMFDRKTLKANRFYVGSERALRTGWGKPTLAEAVEHAKQLQESTGEDQFVVQIVRVVKKKEQPVIVEAVK